MPFIVQRYSNSTLSYSGSQYQSLNGGTKKLQFKSGTSTFNYPLTTNTSASQYCKFKIKVGNNTAFLAQSISTSTQTMTTVISISSRNTLSTKNNSNVLTQNPISSGIFRTYPDITGTKNTSPQSCFSLLTNMATSIPCFFPDVGSMGSIENLDTRGVSYTNTTYNYTHISYNSGVNRSLKASVSVIIQTGNSSQIKSSLSTVDEIHYYLTVTMPVFTYILQENYTETVSKSSTNFTFYTASNSTATTTSCSYTSSCFKRRTVIGKGIFHGNQVRKYNTSYKIYGAAGIGMTDNDYLTYGSTSITHNAQTTFTLTSSSNSSHNINI